MPPLFPLTLALYAVACTLCFVAVAHPQIGWSRRLATPLLACGLLCQGADIAWLCLHGQHPGSSAREALFLASFLMLGLLALRSSRQPQPLLGTLALPVAMVLEVLVRALPPGAAAGSRPGAPWLLALHIVSAALGIALFGIAAAAGVAYLLSERRLKRHLLPRIRGAGQGPSLETLDALNQQGIVFGLLAFTAALVSGTYWLLASPEPGSLGAADPGVLLRLRALLGQPRYTLAVFTWLLFAILLAARKARGLRGRWAAQLTLVGFWTSLGVLAVYLSRDVMGRVP